MKSKLRFKLSVNYLFGEDKIGVRWRAWADTPDARMDFFSEATTWATVTTRATMKKFRQRQHMARMRAAKAAKRLKTAT